MDDYIDLQILKAATSKEAVLNIFYTMTGRELRLINKPEDHFCPRNNNHHQLINYLPTHWAYAFCSDGDLIIWDSLGQPLSTYQDAERLATTFNYLTEDMLFQLPTGREIKDENSARHVSTCGLWTCLAGYLNQNFSSINEALRLMHIIAVTIDSRDKTFEHELDKNSNNFFLRSNELRLQEFIQLHIKSEDIIKDFI